MGSTKVEIGIKGHDVKTEIGVNVNIAYAPVRADAPAGPPPLAPIPGGSFTTILGTAETEYPKDLSVDISGNSYVGGQVNNGAGLGGEISNGGNDGFIIKYDSSGTKQWTKLVGTASNESISGLSNDSAGNIYVTGPTSGDLGGPNSGGIDVFLMKNPG